MTVSGPFGTLGPSVTAHGGELRVWSEHATAMQLEIFDQKDPSWAIRTVDMAPDPGGVWSGYSRSLIPGRSYALRVSGPDGVRHRFDPARRLLDPYARGVGRITDHGWRSYMIDEGFDWGGVTKPRIPLNDTVIYEAHVRGFSRLNQNVPVELRGSYAGLAHPASIEYLLQLGVTTLELLPVHAFVSEQRLIKQGLLNYWGYNTLAFFAPHPAYASPRAQVAGPDAVLREFKGMVRLLHAAGIEVILDVVYNHTAEEGRHGPVQSFRGIDNASYYRQDSHGNYIDVTGCGNTLDFGHPAPVQLVLDSLRYWADQVQIDGFRLDLATTLGRDAIGDFSPEHPLLTGMRADPIIGASKLIAEPWDVGMGGWQTGNFPAGFSEWNDRYRDGVRNFWLGDIQQERLTGSAAHGVGQFANHLTGSSNVFAPARGPLASLNFVTAHDGFTMADLTAYDIKHNIGNGESNRDGTDNNNSYNHGVEGPSIDEQISETRHRAIRNLMGTLLLSAGVPMITAGDEYGRSQRGNNNAYCHNSELTWLSWSREPWQEQLYQVTRELLRLRRENPALRPTQYPHHDEPAGTTTSQMDWYNEHGQIMEPDAWNDPARRTLQYLATRTLENGEQNRILLVVHAHEKVASVLLPMQEEVGSYIRLWDSSRETPRTETDEYHPGDMIETRPTSMQLFHVS